jgi:hypothetical protein
MQVFWLYWLSRSVRASSRVGASCTLDSATETTKHTFAACARTRISPNTPHSGFCLYAHRTARCIKSQPLHVVGIFLLLGRGIHAYGVSREPELSGFRVAGMACTLSVLLAGGLIDVVLALV